MATLKKSLESGIERLRRIVLRDPILKSLRDDAIATIEDWIEHRCEGYTEDQRRATHQALRGLATHIPGININAQHQIAIIMQLFTENSIETLEVEWIHYRKGLGLHHINHI